MVYDVFMFFNEIDLLEIRMNILDPVVDYFVITEANTTQMGENREPIFNNYANRFSKFKNKIIYNLVENQDIKFEDQWHREAFQKNACINGLKSCKDDDIIIFSDLDEIPNPEKVKNIIQTFDKDKIYHFAQDMYYFYLNYKNIDGKLLASCGEFPEISEKKWLGSKLCSYKLLKEIGCDNIRHKDYIRSGDERISDGGWHFTYMGGDHSSAYSRIKTKLGSFSHSEFNSWWYYNRLRQWFFIKIGRDLLGRGAKFKKVTIDDSYPTWLIEHLSNYKHLVLK